MSYGSNEFNVQSPTDVGRDAHLALLALPGCASQRHRGVALQVEI
jgi:hypothetical protein